MASKPPAAPKAEKMKPRVNIHWEGKDLKLSGDAPPLGKRCRLIMDGLLTGFQMEDYGNSLSFEPKSIAVEHQGMAEEGETLVEMMNKQHKPKR